MCVEEVGMLRDYLTESKAVIEQMGILPRAAPRYPFDYIALETISKCISIANACLMLIESRHPDEAYGLSRTVVECSLNLRWLTLDAAQLSAKSSAFVAFSLHNKNFWLHHIRQHFGMPDSSAIEEEVRLWDLTGDPKPAIRNWSKVDTWMVQHLLHPLDPPTDTKRSKSLAYAVDYYQPSQYVHCSQPALDGYIADQGKPFTFREPQVLVSDVPQRVLFILLIHLHEILAYSLFGMNIERPAKLDELFSSTLNSLNAVKTLYNPSQ
jgi:hypothetical protein